MSATKPTSEVAICNLALDYLNQSPITSIDNPTDDTEEICARWYHQTRRALLRKHPWNFATTRTTLPELSITVPYGFSNAYAVPIDFIRLVSLGDDQFIDLVKFRYQIEDGYLYTDDFTSDSTVLKIRYIYDIRDVNQFDSLFTDILSLELALRLARKFTASEAATEEIRAMLKDAIPAGFSVDGQERPPMRRQYSKWLSRRRRGRNTGTAGPYQIFES